jgi:hypothetical protein
MMSRFLFLFSFLLASLLHSPQASAQSGTGLTAKYYDTSIFTTLVTTRTDATVNFDWATAIPSGTAITNAASVAGLLLTTECLITDLPEDTKPAAGGHDHHDH